MNWVVLLLAGLLEVLWSYTMKKSEGFTVLLPTLATFAVMPASFLLLSIAMKSMPLGTAYMIWTGIGALGAFVVGVVVLGEALSPMRLLAAALIVAGIVTMKLASDG